MWLNIFTHPFSQDAVSRWMNHNVFIIENENDWLVLIPVSLSPFFLSASSAPFHFLVFHLLLLFSVSPLEQRFLLSAHLLILTGSISASTLSAVMIPSLCHKRKNYGWKKKKLLNWITFASESVIFPTDGMRLCCFTGTWICGCLKWMSNSAPISIADSLEQETKPLWAAHLFCFGSLNRKHVYQ